MYTNTSTNIRFTPVESQGPKIIVLGLGGGGSNAVNRMIENGMGGVTFVSANTDAQTLLTNLAPIKVQLGPRTTRGLGAGGLPAVGEAAAEESYRELAEILQGADMVFLAAGMGGGTGTGSIPIAAKVSKAVGAVTIAVVTKPFSFELGRRQKNAEEGIRKLQNYCDTLIVIPNDRLLSIAPKDLPLEMAFTLADDVLRQGVQGIAELVTETGLINVDFAHIKRIMEFGGGALMSIGTGEGPNKTSDALNKALHHPLLEEISLATASGIIANFRGGKDLTFREVTNALDELQAQTGNQAEIIPGVIPDQNMENRVEVILIVTGIGGIRLKDLEIKTEVKKPSEIQDEKPINSREFQNSIPKFSENLGSVSSQNQYEPQVNFSSNLDIPAFMRKRSLQGK
jgi:cell division protein FtsZ